MWGSVIVHALISFSLSNFTLEIIYFSLDLRVYSRSHKLSCSRLERR